MEARIAHRIAEIRLCRAFLTATIMATMPDHFRAEPPDTVHSPAIRLAHLSPGTATYIDISICEDRQVRSRMVGCAQMRPASLSETNVVPHIHSLLYTAHNRTVKNHKNANLSGQKDVALESCLSVGHPIRDRRVCSGR